uniref:Efflux transporter, outer membrane factor (OMF) lipoprotein, NodT family n=1 Tax=Candidatus Kentrum sp. FW TaxID=2126338 RepID=A0A450SIQ8_9GAMM|nr:MAG: efflux transporter, outer membrane factor (OMF) lipoprotein, NodT family [Candidatus Kentron sp. FW]
MDFARLGIIFLAVFLAGCVLPSAHKPKDYGEFTPPANWHVEGLETHGVKTHEVETLRELVDSAELAALLDLALTGNPNLKQIALRVSEANALARIKRGARLPTLDFGIEHQSERANGQTTRTTTGTLSSELDLDPWRRLGDSARASELRTKAQNADYEGARISLVAGVLHQVLSILSADKIIAIEEKRLDTLMLNEQFIRNRYLAGLGSLSDLEAARTELAQRRAALHARRESRAANHRALSVLLGRHGEPPMLPATLIVKMPDTALPVTVIGRRPDLVAALARIGAADHEAYAAAKALLPGLSLSFDWSKSASTIGDIPGANPISTLLAGIAAPLFRGGQLRAERDRSGHVAERAYWAYRETLLRALIEVEDALGREVSLREQSKVLQGAIGHAEKNRRIFESRYREGIASIFDLLRAQQTAFDAQIDLLDINLARDSNRVDLAAALGLGL